MLSIASVAFFLPCFCFFDNPVCFWFTASLCNSFISCCVHRNKNLSSGFSSHPNWSPYMTLPKWKMVEIVISTSFFSTQPQFPFLRLWVLLILGGMELNKRARALGQGIKAADLSLKGCFRNMSFDGKRTGLQDARTTQGLLPECVWNFPCVQQPCVAGSECRQVGVEWFQCDCGQRQECIKPEFAEKYKVRMFQWNLGKKWGKNIKGMKLRSCSA